MSLTRFRAITGKARLEIGIALYCLSASSLYLVLLLHVSIWNRPPWLTWHRGYNVTWCAYTPTLAHLVYVDILITSFQCINPVICQACHSKWSIHHCLYGFHQHCESKQQSCLCGFLLTINLQLAAWTDSVTSRSASGCADDGSSMNMITWDEPVHCEEGPLAAALTLPLTDREAFNMLLLAAIAAT